MKNPLSFRFFRLVLIISGMVACTARTAITPQHGEILRIGHFDSLKAYNDHQQALKENELTRLTGIDFSVQDSDSLNFRIWQYGPATRCDQERVYRIINRQSRWEVRMVTFWTERFDGDSIQLHIYQNKSLGNYFDGTALMREMNTCSMFSLPDEDLVQGYGSGMNDADAVHIDFTTPTRERSYKYTALHFNESEFEEARQMLRFLKYLERSFYVSDIWTKVR